MSATPTTHDSRHPLLIALLLALVVAAMNIGLWWWGNLPHGPDDWHGPIGGFSVSVFQRYQNPLQQDFPSDAEIDSDLKLLRKYTGAHPHLFHAGKSADLPPGRSKDGLQVMAGANIDTRLGNNEREIDDADRAGQPLPGDHQPGDRRQRGAVPRRPARSSR